VLVAIWFAVVGGGYTALIRYKTTPGAATHAPVAWPTRSALVRAANGPTLVMFLHPHCPCSTASLSELLRLMSHARDAVSVRVVLVLPEGVDAEWKDTGLRARALAIPGIEVLEDEGGIEAARFGAMTSGACVLYDAAGRLAFAGGITALRGHEGESAGEDRILTVLKHGAPDRPDSPVFGCGLRDQEAAPRPSEDGR
jgi:hypothetical protein